MWLYVFVFAISFLISFFMIEYESGRDYLSIEAGKGDNHMGDVVASAGVVSIIGVTMCLILGTLGGLIIIPIYCASRFSLFNALLNNKRGLDDMYLSNRGWDKIYGELIPKPETRKRIQDMVLILSILYLYPLYKWLSTYNDFI